MPRSFLVKKCKNVSPFGFSKKAQQQVVNEENNERYFVKELVQSSQSAFVSFSSNSESGKIDENKLREKTSSGLLVPSSLPLTRTERVRFNALTSRTPQIEPVEVIYNEPKKPNSPDTEKENYQSNQSDDISNVPSVKGPLSQSTFVCQLCKKVFQAAFFLAQHKCSGIKHIEHRCPECDKIFSCPANLASHRRWHRPRSPGSNKPQKLPKRAPATESNSNSATEEPSAKRSNEMVILPTEGNTDIDMKSEDEMETENSEDAGSPLDQNNNEIEDKSIQETQNSKYICEECGKTFKRPAYLRKHMNYHNNSRPYPCQYCGKVFRTLTNRAKHVLEHAVGSKSFSCTACGNQFSSKSGLEKHSRIHGGEVYNCNECSGKFNSVPGLERHMSKAH